MKFTLLSTLLSLGACLTMSVAPALTQNQTTVNIDSSASTPAALPMPATGTYFVSNVASGEALEPAGPTAGQNVFLYPYNKSGRQKWVFTRQVDPKTHKPTNRYLIRLLGEDTTLVFQPHPVVERTALITPGASLFTIVPGPEGYTFKSVTLNGDAMCAFHVQDSYTEVHFMPDDGSTKFRWKIEATD